MSPVYLLLVISYIFTLSFGTPINDGEDVGTVKQKGKSHIVSGQSKYPFIVRVSVFFKRDNKLRSINCAGVIIARRAVLTAGHCLYPFPNPKIVVHAGIVDKEYEEDGGQKLLVDDFLLHEEYEHTCELGDGRCCYGINDIAILWTVDNFRFGSTIKAAVLNKKVDKLIGKEGWILGWGLNSEMEFPSMLQRGAMKILPKQECERINPIVFVDNNVLCLGPVSKATRANQGDSGGPFVRNGKVYGLSSISVFQFPCLSRALDLFTNVAVYSIWIKNNLIDGAPKSRKTSERPRQNM